VYVTGGSDGVLPIFESKTASIRAGFTQVGWVCSKYPDRGFSHTPAGSASSGAAGWEAIDPTTYPGGGARYLVWWRGHYTTGFYNQTSDRDPLLACFNIP
jgi:hypothetical protein